MRRPDLARRAFSRQMGETPKQHMLRLQLDRACALLAADWCTHVYWPIDS